MACTALALTIVTTPALAASDYGIGKIVNQATRKEAQASQAATKQADRLANAKKVADKMVDNRINDLNKIGTRIQNDKRLSADEKTSLSSDVQSSISGLTALKTKIDGEITVDAVRADANSVVTTYRVYMVEMPKIQLLITIDNLQTLNTNLQGLTPKLDSLIATLQSQGKDVSTLTPIVADIKTQLQSISTQLATDKSTVMAVTPTSTNSQATFTSVRKDLAGVRSMFAKVRADVASLRQNLNTTLKPTGAAAPSGATSSSTSTNR